MYILRGYNDTAHYGTHIQTRGLFLIDKTQKLD